MSTAVTDSRRADDREQRRAASEDKLLRSLGRRPLPRYWFTRLYIALSVLVSVTITIIEPTTLAHRLILGKAGYVGWLSLLTLGVIAVLAVLDGIVNDALPARFVLPTAKRYRHLVYVALSLGLVGITYVIASRAGYSPLMWSYWLDATAAIVVAYLDLFSRHREGRS